MPTASTWHLLVPGACTSRFWHFHPRCELACKILGAARLRLLTQLARPHTRPVFCRDEIPFAYPVHGRLRNDSKRRRRRRPEGVAHSASFTPIAGHSRTFAKAMHFQRQDPVPCSWGRSGLWPTMRTNCIRPSRLGAGLARSCCRGIPLLSPSLQTPESPSALLSPRSSSSLTYSSAHHDGTTTVAHLRG
jgi:hypothetical protein